MPVKGRREPVEVYELSGLGPAPSRLQAAARRGLTRFVARDDETQVLRRSFVEFAWSHHVDQGSVEREHLSVTRTRRGSARSCSPIC